MKTYTNETILPLELSVLLTGPPGGGKTTLMLQFPGLHVLDCDQNLAGPIRWLREKKLFKPFTCDTIPLLDNGTSVPIEDQWNRLKHCTNAALLRDDVKTIAVDSLTHVDRMLQAWTKSHLKKSQDADIGPFEWNPFKSQLYNWIMSIRSTKKTLIICCHEKIEYAKDQTVAAYIPALSTNLKDYFGYIFSDVWRCEIRPGAADTVKATVRTHPTAVSDLKNSLLLGKDIEAKYSEIEKHLPKG